LNIYMLIGEKQEIVEKFDENRDSLIYCPKMYSSPYGVFLIYRHCLHFILFYYFYDSLPLAQRNKSIHQEVRRFCLRFVLKFWYICSEMYDDYSALFPLLLRYHMSVLLLCYYSISSRIVSEHIIWNLKK
jgi:hypothetical protein